jgi:hypothetical protein
MPVAVDFAAIEAGSDSSSLAALMALKRSSAFGSPGLRSGCEVLASFRNALRICLSVASRAMPSVV